MNPISVIIPVFNDAVNLKQCLDAVLRIQYSEFECIVVDDGSDDDSFQTATRYPCRVLRNSRAPGPAGARNCGADKAQGDILFFIDADVAVPPDILSRIDQWFTAHPDGDAVIGSYDAAPEAGNFISQYKNLFHHFVHQQSRESASTFWAGCGAVKRDVFRRFGGFDEHFRRPSVEDIDLGYRLTLNGRRIKLEKSLQVRHLKQWTLFRLMKTDIFQRGIPWTRLILKYRRFQNDLNIAGPQRSGAALVCTFFSLALISWALAGSVHAALLFCLLAAASDILVNMELYRFFAGKRGRFFAFRALPLHMVYYVYCGFSFIIGVLTFHIQKIQTVVIGHSSKHKMRRGK